MEDDDEEEYKTDENGDPIPFDWDENEEPSMGGALMPDGSYEEEKTPADDGVPLLPGGTSISSEWSFLTPIVFLILIFLAQRYFSKPPKRTKEGLKDEMLGY
jgi:hypothetical protein